VLVRGPNGTTVPSTSLFGMGQLVVMPLGTFDGHLSFDLAFASDANLTYLVRPFFTSGPPRQMVYGDDTSIVFRYVHVDP
jgi:hypothetical protein